MRLEIGLPLLKKAAEGALHAQQAIGIDAVQFDHLAGRGFKKVAVVADGDGGERGRGEQLLQPFDSSQIEVVGRLVEQHHIGLNDHGFGDCQPLSPTAGECGGLDVEVGKAGSAGEFAEPPLAVGFPDVGAGQRGFQYLADGEAGSEARVLRDVRGAGTFAHCQFAGVRLDLPGQNRQQGGFAGAVGADEADAGAVFHGERDVAKQGSGAELLGDGLRVEDRRHLYQDYRVAAQGGAKGCGAGDGALH